MRRASKILLGMGLALITLAACTKELPYKEEGDKFDVKNKAVLDTKSEYLYSASTGSITRTSSSAVPFSMDENRRVRLEWTKDALRVLETERDARYSGNAVNHKLVLEIPVEHIEYQCAKDAYGECTNKEEERKDIDWNQKAQFKFKPEAAKAVGLSFLPILGDKTLGDDCHTEVAAKVLDVKIEQDALNLSIERTFQVAPHCLEFSPDSSISGAASVSAVYHYSMTKLDSVLSKDFEPISYPDFDSGKFGFFSTERAPLGSDNVARESGKHIVMNHWNPNKKEIVYYLSDEFAKPVNQKVRELTYQTVKNLNEGLAEADVNFRIKLMDPAGKNPGDNRNSMIVLVEDPVASGLLGYGPQVEDPVTGEIISARTVMFLGTMKSAISRTYEEIRLEKAKKRGGKDQSIEQDKGDSSDEGDPNGGLIIENGLKNRIKAARFNTKNMTLKKLTAKSPSSKSSVKQSIVKANIDGVIKDIKNYQLRKNSEYSGNLGSAKEAHIAHYKYLHEVKSCSLGESTPGFATGLSEKVASLVDDDAKPWHDLSDKEKNQMIDKLLPVMWIPTLIHEMGHNLGLRHNFQASEDKDNFYSSQELSERGLEYTMPFSSVMEYAEDTMALTKLGKYDIAALRFGYKREVDVKGAKGGYETIKVENTLDRLIKAKQLKDEDLKPYGYCTDEHAGINAGCRRFDMGTTYTEIIKNDIENYHRYYTWYNFRRDRQDFSLFGDIGQARNRFRSFVNMRLMQEVMERVLSQISLEDPRWQTEPFLSDLKQASDLAGRFLMDVVATPDLHCLISKKDNPNEILFVQPISTISPNETSCLGMELTNGYMVVGQFGKLFNSRKDPNSENRYADQIDVRGYWIDKLMAARVLFARSLGNSILDKETGNYADRPDFRPMLQSLLFAHILNGMAGVQKVELADGGTIELELPVDSFSTHVIDKPLHPAIAQVLGIPNGDTNFNQLLAHEAAKYMTQGQFALSGKDFAESLQVNRLKATDAGGAKPGMLELQLGTERFVAAPQNILAYEALARRQIVTVLEKVDRDTVIEIYQAKEKDPAVQAPADASNELKYAYSLPADILEGYLMGSFASPAFYEELVNMLPN